jgi:tryptophan synthase alpha subunit
LTGEAKTKRLAEIEKDITYLKSVGITESSENETMKKLLAERSTLNPPAAVSSEDQKTKRLAEIEKDITYLKSVGLTETSDNETMKKLVAERNSLNAPAAPVAMSAPAPAKVPEKQIPWSLCSIEKRGVL